MRGILLIVALLAATAQAASPEDVREVVAMVTDGRVPSLARHNYKNGDRSIVFVHGGRRYTLYHSGPRIDPNDPQSAWLSVWVRNESPSKGVDTFTDFGSDGVVDFGLDGPRLRLFHEGRARTVPEGLNHREYWQKQYDDAIAAALAYKRRTRR